MKRLFTLWSLLFVFAQVCFCQDTTLRVSPTVISKDRWDSLKVHIPEAKGFVNDYVHLFTENEVRSLDSLVHGYQNQTTVEIVIVIVDSSMVKKEDLEDYSLVLLNTWGVGKKQEDKGIAIVIAPALRRIRIENGYGIEPFLSDGDTKQIIDSFFIPRFKESKYFEGTRDGIIAITQRLKKNGL